MISTEWQPKLFTLLKEGITKKQIQKDITAGIMVGIIALPLAIAFAIASGVSPEVGIQTAIIGGLIISILGGSRVQIGGPTGAFIVIIFSIIKRYGMDGLLISTFLAGIILILMGLFRMGSLLKYIPQTLITGFTTAIGAIIFTTQIKDFLGLPAAGIPESFLGKWGYYISHIHCADPWSLTIGLTTIILILLIPRISGKVPPAFAALILTTLAAKLAGLPVETIGSRFGNLAFSLPHLQHFNLNPSRIAELLPPAITIALLGALESLLSAVVADSMIGGHHRSNIELIAQGTANAILPLFGGIPATGAIARTAANINNGGRTPLAGIIHAATLLLIYVVAMPVVGFIPMSTLAGILIIVAWNMSELHVFRNTLKINRYESIVLLTTFALTLITDLTVAIPAGFILSTILFMKRMSDSMELTPLMTSKVNDQKIFSQEIGEYSRHIRIFELNGPMFFGSVHHLLNLKGSIKKDTRVLILRFRYVPLIDTSGLTKLEVFLKDMKKKNIHILFSGVNDRLKEKFNKMGTIEETNIFPEIQDAIAYGETL